MLDDRVYYERLDPKQQYAMEAYEFIYEALAHTQRRLGRVPPKNRAENIEEADEYHVSARELVEGAVDLAIRQFGYLAPVVFKLWGIHKTDDFGHIVFNLIEAGMMSKTEEDQLEDFFELFDLEQALRSGFRIRLEEED